MSRRNCLIAGLVNDDQGAPGGRPDHHSQALDGRAAYGGNEESGNPLPKRTVGAL